MGVAMQEADARVIIQELNTTQKALMRLMRELEGIKANGQHTQALINATRAEVAEARALFKNAEAKARGEESPFGRILQTITYRPPTPRTVFSKDAPAEKKPRVFINNKEVEGGKISHVVRAKDASGYIMQLPCNYDQAHKFLSMEAPNRRKHWRGKRTIYSAMLDLCLRVGFVERKGRGYTWAERFDVWRRLEWLSQFKPPHRVR